MKILIVDDNPDDRRLLRYIVEKNGHEAIEAVDGFDGLRMAKQVAPDLIISDALMPVMDGFQFLRGVQQEQGLRTIPFIFYSSSYKEYQDVRLAMSLGADAYFIKPVDPVELWGKIKDFLSAGKKEKSPPAPLIEEDAAYLKQYSQVVAAKLEEKVRELERTLTERNQAVEKLRESEEYIRTILNSVDEGFIVVDRQYRILSANKAFCRFVNTAEERVTGQHCYQVSHHSSRPCSEAGEECAVKGTFETGLPSLASHVHEGENGAKRYVEIKSYPIADASGAVVSAIETITDVTERKLLEDQLRQAQKMESIGTLAGGIAHDFNNILSAIIGYGNIVLMKMPKDDPQRLNVEHMLDAGDRAAHLTKDLLLFSRKQISERKPVDLNDIIRKVETFLKRVIGEDVECRTLLANEPLPVLGDAHQLEQVLMNFATNARDAMPKGGMFSISTEQVRFDSEFISAHGFGKPGSYVLATISDTGKGMDEAVREHIFEPFFTTKEVGKGTGLGLAVVYGIVSQHEGFINVYSEPGEGSIFKIYLPLIKANVDEIAATTDERPRGGTETILLAEDDEVVRNLIRTILEEFGYRVIAANDGRDAVLKYQQNREAISLLLFDLIMPMKTGKEACDEIRAINPDIKVAFLSGYAADLIGQHALLDEKACVMQKPISPTLLLKKVREELDKK